MKYKLKGTITRTVVETFETVIEEDSPSDAKDVLFEILSEYPDSELVVERLLKVDEVGSTPTNVNVEFVGQVDDEDD